MAITLRDYAKQTGLDVGYDPNTKKVTLGNKTLAPNQLQALGGTLTDGSWTFGDTSKLGTLTGKTPAPTPQPTPQPTVAPTPTPQAPMVDVADLERQKRINEFERAYQQSLGKLAQEEQKAIQGFEANRSQARTQGIMNAKAFEDYLAQKGISTSGTAPQGFIQQQGQLQGALGASQRQQQQYGVDLGRQRAQLASDLEFNKSQAEIDAQLAQAQQAEERRLIEEERALEAQRTSESQLRDDFQNTILANYNDLQGFANRLQAQGAPQWQIDQVLAARQQKIADQGLDQQGRPIVDVAGQQQALLNLAFKKWDAGIPLNREEMQILGTNTPTKPRVVSGGGSSTTTTQDRNFAFDLWEALGTANDAVSSILGIPVGTKFGEGTPTKPTDISDYQSYINNYFTKEDDAGRKYIDKGSLIPYLIRLDQGGNDAQAIALANFYGITESEIEQIERVMGGSTNR